MAHYKAKLLSIASAIIFSAVYAFAESANTQDCPVPPKSSDLVWEYSLGDDFSVCEGKIKGVNGSIGVYNGGHPSSKSNPVDFVTEGTVEGVPVRWYKMYLMTKNGYQFNIETLYRAKRRPKINHIWVSANDEKTLESLRVLAEQMNYTRK